MSAGKGKPHRWQKGQKSPNPKGRPKEGQSWAAIIKEVTEMSPDQVAKLVGVDTDLGKSFLLMPKRVKIKYLVVTRAVAALMFDPSPSLFAQLMEREDGKVPEKMDMRHDLTIEGFDALLKKVYGRIGSTD